MYVYNIYIYVYYVCIYMYIIHIFIYNMYISVTGSENSIGRSLLSKMGKKFFKIIVC